MELEKELQLAAVRQQSTAASVSPDVALGTLEIIQADVPSLMPVTGGQPRDGSGMTMIQAGLLLSTDSPTMAITGHIADVDLVLTVNLQERDETIHHLKAALHSSSCRAAVLEQNLLECYAAGNCERRSPEKILRHTHMRDVLAQSAMHFQQYHDIRSNYNSLLSR